MNVLYKRDVISGLFFNEGLVAAEDPDFNFRILKKGYRLLLSNDLWVYHHNPTSVRSVCKKWFNYGKYYPFAYFLNGRWLEGSLLIRIIYFPLLLFGVVMVLWHREYWLYFSVVCCVLPLCYFVIGMRAGIGSCRMLLVFTLVHSIKQLAQIVGIWWGLLGSLLCGK
jgi:hypothetical protein